MVTQGCHGTALDRRGYVSRPHPHYISYAERRITNQLSSSSPLSVLTHPGHHHRSHYPPHSYHHHDIRAAAQAATLFPGGSMPEPVLEESTPPRKRIAVACQRCRKRKIRCSGDPGNGQACSNCKNAGTEPCLFLRVSSQEAPFRDPTVFPSYVVSGNHPPSSRAAYCGARTAASPLGHYGAEELSLNSTLGTGDMLAHRVGHTGVPSTNDHHSFDAKSGAVTAAAAYYHPWPPSGASTTAATTYGHSGEPPSAGGSMEFSSMACASPATVMGYEPGPVHLMPYAGSAATDGYSPYHTATPAALVRSNTTASEGVGAATAPQSPYSGFRGIGGLANALPSSVGVTTAGSTASNVSPVVGRSPLSSAPDQYRSSSDAGGSHYSTSTYDATYHHGHHGQHSHYHQHHHDSTRGSPDAAVSYSTPSASDHLFSASDRALRGAADSGASDASYDYKPRIDSMSPGGGSHHSGGGPVGDGSGSCSNGGELANGQTYQVAHAAGSPPPYRLTSSASPATATGSHGLSITRRATPSADDIKIDAAVHRSDSTVGTLLRSA